MNDAIPAARTSPLRQRLIDDMNMRRFSRETQRNYIRDVGRFATFVGRSPATATAEDLHRFQGQLSTIAMLNPTFATAERRGGSPPLSGNWHAGWSLV
jgi:integrase/recombinase XerD